MSFNLIDTSLEPEMFRVVGGSDSSENSLLSGNPTRSSHFYRNSSEIEILLNLHDVIKRFNNYTQQAKSCEPDPNSSLETDINEIATSYKQLHGYIALLVCVFGVIANCLIMVVLRRKEMRTPVNLMLFALAIADLLIMIEYIPFALHMYVIDQGVDAKYSYPSAAFVFFHVHFTQILHTISIQLTLTMAIWRYAAIRSSNRSTTFCTFKRCYQVIGAAYICPFFFCILNYLYFQIVLKTKYITVAPKPFDEIDGDDAEKLQIFETMCKFKMHNCSIRKVDLYIVDSSDLVKEYPILHTIHFWTFSVLIKLIPCVILTFFMCWMVNTLYKARRRHKLLENKSALSLKPVNQSQPLYSGVATTATNTNGTTTVVHLKKENHSRSIKFAVPLDSTQEDEFPTAALLNGDGEPSNVTETQRGSDASTETGSSKNGSDSATFSARRFTKGLIKFPSIRRPSVFQKSKSSKSSKRADRTSKMLLAVLFLFLLTEFPQGIMHFLTGWYGPEFFRCKYNPWAEVWDILAIINSAINFILYCLMSKQFRTQFKMLVKVNLCFRNSRLAALAKCNNNATVSTTV